MKLKDSKFSIGDKAYIETDFGRIQCEITAIKFNGTRFQYDVDLNRGENSIIAYDIWEEHLCKEEEYV